jgi:hypothetical protein
MSNPPVFAPPASAEQPRPVSLFTIVFVLVLFAAFFLVVRSVYTPVDVAPQNAAPENLGEEMQWRATRESRRAALIELRQEQAQQASSYRWIDQQAGILQLPIERAMELTLEQYRGGNESRPAPGQTAPPPRNR